MSFELLLISVVAGSVCAMSGMGGGMVLIPAPTSLGLAIKHAIAISVVSVIATSNGSASASVRNRIRNLRAGTFLERSSQRLQLSRRTSRGGPSWYGPLMGLVRPPAQKQPKAGDRGARASTSGRGHA